MAKDSDGNDDDQPDRGSHSDRISASVKRVYDDVASEPLPDKLVDLLNALQSGDAK